MLIDYDTIISIARGLRARAKQSKAPISGSAIIRACFEDLAVSSSKKLEDRVASVLVIQRRPDGTTERCIVYNGRKNIQAQRYNIACSLGHLVTGFIDTDEPTRIETIAIDYEPQALRRQTVAQRSAHMFACELLVPLTLVQTELAELGVDLAKDFDDSAADNAASHLNVPSWLVRHRAATLRHMLRTAWRVDPKGSPRLQVLAGGKTAR
jgi:hypothetical protein